MKKIAILDMNNGIENQGLRCIKEITSRYADRASATVFDVRAKEEIPDLSYDIYISSGGPGSPFDGDGQWDVKYYDLIEQLWVWNRHNKKKKYVFFICHSFQMACIHFKIGTVTNRKSKSFGIFPVHKTSEGKKDLFFQALPNPFFVADFRDFQVVQPNEERLKELGASVIALEKIRDHIPLERAVMGVRFSREFFGVQFHPEADADGMMIHFQKPALKEIVIKNHGEEKYKQILKRLADPDKIELTNEVLIPTFLENSLNALEAMNISTKIFQ